MTIRLLALALLLAAPAANADEAAAPADAAPAPAEPAPPAPAAPAPAPATPAPAEPAAATTSPSAPAPQPASFGAYDSAATLPAGRVQVGVFAPLRWGITDDVELEIHPLVSLAAPSPLVRVTHLRSGSFTLTGEYGLSYPSFLLEQTRGYLFPTGTESGQLGQHLVPRLGLVGTAPVSEKALLTVRGDVAFGLPLAGGNVRSLDSFIAPLELLLAPLFRGFRAHLGVGYDRPLNDFLRLRATVNADVVGSQPEGFAQSSPFFLSAHLGLDVKVGDRSRFTVGAIWWNWDAFATALEPRGDGTFQRVRVRSNDFLPTVDFVFGF